MSKADVLIEALGYIRKFHGRHTVIKLGGSVMEHENALRHVLLDIVFMETVGMRPVVVHGGGAAIDRAMDAAGLVPKMKFHRVTDSRPDAGFEALVVPPSLRRQDNLVPHPG